MCVIAGIVEAGTVDADARARPILDVIDAFTAGTLSAARLWALVVHGHFSRKYARA